MNNHNNGERIARVEGNLERVLDEVKDLRSETRELRSQSRQDFRFLLGTQLTTALALVAVMAKGFGWV
jgi:hypothetical protein